MPRGNPLAGMVLATHGFRLHRNLRTTRRLRDGRGRGPDRDRRRRALRTRGIRPGGRRGDAARISEDRGTPGRHPARRRGPERRGPRRGNRNGSRQRPARKRRISPAPRRRARGPGAERSARERAKRVSETLHAVSVEVNGKPRSARVPARLSLVDWLREELLLTGTHIGCEHGICGACSVMLDGEPVRACLMYAVQAHGHRVTTVEGLAKPDGSMSVLQDSFCETHGLQCGYCTPGMLIAAQALLNTNPDPTEAQIRDAIGGNLCRCTGYQQIVEAVQLAAERVAKEGK